MSLDHALIEELSAADALDGLDEADQATLARERAVHGDCDECRRIEAGFRDTAAFMALSLAPASVAPAMADAILAASTTRDDPAPAPTTVEAAAPPDDLGARREGRSRRWTRVLAAAATFVVLAVALGSYVLSGRTTAGRITVAEQRVVRFTPGEGVSGTLAMAYTPGRSGVVFWGTDLPDPGRGKVYEIWMISGATPVSGGCVTPRDGRIAAFVNADVGAADLMAVTTEPASCPSAPTSDPVLTAPLTV